jgi:hypothetical protein
VDPTGQEERLRQLEDEYEAVSRQIKQLLMDIRIFSMEASSPLWDRAKSEQQALVDHDGEPK